MNLLYNMYSLIKSIDTELDSVSTSVVTLYDIDLSFNY